MGSSSSRKGPKAPRDLISGPHEGAGAPTGGPEPQAKPAEEAFPTGAPSLGQKCMCVCGGSFQQIQPWTGISYRLESVLLLKILRQIHIM